MRSKNSEKKLVKSQFHYCRFLSFIIAIYLRLVLLYIYSSREIKILKLTKVLLRKNGFIICTAFLFKITYQRVATLAASFQFSSLTRPKNSEKKLIKSWFHYHRFSNLVIAIYLQLASSYMHSSREIKILKLTKVLLQKNGSIVYTASLLKRDIL